MTNKQWTCNNQCKKDCCSFIYLELSNKQFVFFDQERLITYDKKWKDWLSYHKEFKIINENTAKLKRFVKYKLVKNPYNGKYYVYVKSKCNKLMRNGRCKIYRTRPSICRFAPCLFENSNKMIEWFGKTIRGEKVE